MIDKNVKQLYLSPKAIPLDIEEYMFRGCKCWIFRREVKRWAPTELGLHRWRKACGTANEYPYNQIPENERRYYQKEFWMGVSDYFTKYNCEFEETVEKEIGESVNKEEAKYRLENYINNHYAEALIDQDIL